MFSISCLKTYQDTPEPLKKLCLKQIISEPVNLCRYVLPPELGNLIAVAFREHAIANRFDSAQCENFFKHFKHRYLPLKKIDFSLLPIKERLFMNFISEYQDLIEEINISNCYELLLSDIDTFNRILKKTPSHKTLIIGETYYKMIDSYYPKPDRKILDDDLKLKKFVIHKIPAPCTEEFEINRQLAGFLSPALSNSLRYLDLSGCQVGKGSAFMQLESLEVLILYNCIMTSYMDVVSAISQLKNLRVLDLSKQVMDPEEVYMMRDEPKALDLIVCRLPQLTRLDISGTNLIGGKDRHISAFEVRMNNPFEFLGLFHTGNDAAYRSNIPALTVAGEANETQVLNACEAYMDRPEQLSKALNDLYNLYKTITPNETFDKVNRALEVVLPILTKHISDEQVIIFTTAAIWCIVKINVSTKNLNDARVRRTITSKLLDVMHYHELSRVILINGGLTLLFLPDIICEHSRVATISLKMCQDPDPRTQGFGTTLLNTLACQVGGDEKVFIGKLKAVEIMINIIKTKIADETCDEILETAWSTLWNITDETPVNCRRFLDFQGLDTFERCMDKFGDNKYVLRNIMGLLGNVAECKSLRVNFMKARYIRRFHALLSSHIDGIECSYNACGILAHLISDGHEFWMSHLVSSDLQLGDVLRDMRESIRGWPINSRRNINYRSFKPIVRLLELHVASDAQYWAVFALANLTRINPAKYCPMLIPHDGLNYIKQLALPGASASYVQNLAEIILYQYDKFESEGTLHGLEQCDSVDLEVIKNFRAEPNQSDGASELGELIL